MEKKHSQDEYLDQIFGEPSIKQGLKFFNKSERSKIRFRMNKKSQIEIHCAKRNSWLRAKPEEVVRQLFLVWIQASLKYPLSRILVEWPIQMGGDAEKERTDITIFSDDACTDPYIVFELKKPASTDGLEQLRSYLRWTGCFFGCWSNGSEYSFQLREEDEATKKGPYKYRTINRLPKLGEDLNDILKPLTYEELQPISDMRSLIVQLEHDALANAGVNAFDELFKLIFAKLHDEFRPRADKRYDRQWQSSQDRGTRDPALLPQRGAWRHPGSWLDQRSHPALWKARHAALRSALNPNNFGVSKSPVSFYVLY